MTERTTMTTGNFFRYYNKLNGADRYLLFFVHEGYVWMADLKHLSRNWCRVERESSKNGGWQKWKLVPSKLPKEKLARRATTRKVMTVVEFDSLKGANKGWKCEQWLVDNFDCTTPDCKNARFDRCGDVRMNGVEYQVKFENASLTNVHVLHNAQRDAREARKALALA